MAKKTRAKAASRTKKTGSDDLIGKRIQFDRATWEAVDLLARDQMKDLAEITEEAFRDLLKKHGIPVVQDLPGVGENLQDHLQIRAVFKVDGVATLNTLANSWWGKMKIGMEYAMKRSGPMSMAPSQLGAFTRSSPDQPWPNIEYHVQPLSLDAFGEPLHGFNAFTASVCNLRPSSRGSGWLMIAVVAPVMMP